ncbi:hypothetical protein MPSEU_000643800 [Mayamaea pseudoterrestris]|nr:hypothetical protein MPSEU_000643800 [Mayamaea pseudoterrestris]
MSGNNLKKAGERVAKTVLRPPRAVTVAEAKAKTIAEPTRIDTKSATTTMMPWKGWISRMLEDTLGKERYEKMREVVFFMPKDLYDLTPAPIPSKKIRISKPEFPEVKAAYRYPSPGSQPIVREPEFEENEDPYDTGYFKRDTRRRYLSSEQPAPPMVQRLQVELLEAHAPEAAAEVKHALEAGPQSSRGNKGVFATGPSDFDPTGLRATMSVNWKSLNESLDANMPNHLPTPVWAGHEDEIKAWYQERNLPVPIGAYYSALKVPVERRVARW